MCDWSELLESWLAQHAINSKDTARCYRVVGRVFLKLFPDLAAVTPLDVHNWAYSPGPTGRTPAPHTIEQRLSTMSSWYKWLQRYGYLQVNPVMAVERPKTRPPEPRAFDGKQLELLLENIAPKSKLARVRYKAVMVTMVLCGLRLSEVWQLSGSTLYRDENGNWCFRVRAKGGKLLRRNLPPPAVQAIALYLGKTGRTLDRLKKDERVWTVNKQAFQACISRTGFRHGFTAHAHRLRHTAALVRFRAGVPLEAIQHLLGHTYASTTSRYLMSAVPQEDVTWQDVVKALGWGDDSVPEKVDSE